MAQEGALADDVVVGVYLERSGGLIMRAIAYGADSGFKTIAPTDIREISWDPADINGARRQLRELAHVAVDMGGPELAALSIASYGPFKSLKRSNLKNEFGVIQGQGAAPPLGGVNLRDVFYQEIVKGNASLGTRMTVHTDAEACAIGEALVRKTGERDLLIYILCGEGIGMGVVQGRRPLSSALHSEIGMLHVAYSENDIFPRSDKEKNPDEHYVRSLSEVASNKALRERYVVQRRIKDANDVTDSDIVAERDGQGGVFRELNFQLQGYYLAQACLACTVTFAPHFIVIGSDLEPGGGIEPIENRADAQFRDMLKGRANHGQAVFSYGELEDKRYITGPHPTPFTNIPASIRVTGALGITYAAANSAYGARHPTPNPNIHRK